MKNGLIIKSISGEYTVFSEELYVCKPRGVFRHQDKSPKVGDCVDFDEKTLTIIKIHDRKNELVRPVIANVDYAILVFSIVEPDLNLQLLDRILSILEYQDISSVIVFTKNDLLQFKDTNFEEAYNNAKEYYKKIGYPVLESINGSCYQELKQYVENNVCVCIGQSGVGKSTILNAIDPTLNIKTAEISKALGRGKHTTRHIELIKVGNGWLADSPGFGTVNFDDIDELTFSHTFVEFFKESENCRFSKCTHTNEPGCNIKALVDKNEILGTRYRNYLTFIQEVKQNKKNKY